MPALARVALALLFTLGVPRARGLWLTLFALALVLGGAYASLVSTTMPIALFALIVGIATFLALVLPQLLPRLFLALASCAALPFALIASWHGKVGVGLAMAGLLVVFVLAVRKPDWMIRIAGASAGALCLSGLEASAEEHPLPVRLALFALLFALEELVRRSWPQRTPTLAPIKQVATLGATLGAAWMLAILLLPWVAVRPLGVARDDPPPADRPALPRLPFDQRLSALVQETKGPDPKNPRWGLIWPLPSEAITWDEPNLDRALFPFFENLDARFVGLEEGPRLVSLNPQAASTWLGELLAPISLHKPIARLRLVHDEAALARLRAAAQATVAALDDVLPMVRAGTPEAAIEAALKIAMRRHGCGPESFPLILASGPAAAAPHGSGNLGTLRDGDLLVADIGCTIDHYASDFTRTLPVSGSFTPRQKLLYDNVFAAQAAAIAACKPGAVLNRGGADGSLDDLARKVLKERAPDGEAHMPHSLGHSVGLFVHDIWSGAPLEPGNVITIEPGTYLAGELGIRIEDTFVVTKDGCEALTQGFAASSEAIEARLRGTSPPPRLPNLH